MPTYGEFLQAGETCYRGSFDKFSAGFKNELEESVMSNGGNKLREICR